MKASCFSASRCLLTLRHLTATACSNPRWCARYTTPKPPSPTTESIRYLSSSTCPTQPNGSSRGGTFRNLGLYPIRRRSWGSARSQRFSGLFAWRLIWSQGHGNEIENHVQLLQRGPQTKMKLLHLPVACVARVRSFQLDADEACWV